ncbi:reverse transcriptase domain-containing protein [Tanacetum coccineum]
MSTKGYEKKYRSRLGSKGRSVSARFDSHNQSSYLKYTDTLSESKDSGCVHWKSRSKKNKLSKEEDDLSQPWVCEEVEPLHPESTTLIFQRQECPVILRHMTECKSLVRRLPPESVDSYDDLKKAFLENYLQQKKCIKDPIELHNIKQRDEESTEDFVKRYKLETMDVKGAPKCMRIFGFVHEIINPELIKRSATNHAKFCDIHSEVGHTTNECMHIKKQIEEMLQAGKLSHLIKEIKQNRGKEQPKAAKKGEPSGKDKVLAILMVQTWERVARQKITQAFPPIR